MNEKDILLTENLALKQRIQAQQSELLNRSSHIVAGFIDVLMATVALAESGDPNAKAQLAKLTRGLERAKEASSKLTVARNGG